MTDATLSNDWESLRAEVRLAWDTGDAFGSAFAWWFACAEILHFERDGEPDSWCYSPGAAQEPEPDRYESDVLRDYDSETIERLGNLCSRVVDICKARGMDY